MCIPNKRSILFLQRLPFCLILDACTFHFVRLGRPREVSLISLPQQGIFLCSASHWGVSRPPNCKPNTFAWCSDKGAQHSLGACQERQEVIAAAVIAI